MSYEGSEVRPLAGRKLRPERVGRGIGSVSQICLAPMPAPLPNRSQGQTGGFEGCQPHQAKQIRTLGTEQNFVCTETARNKTTVSSV